MSPEYHLASSRLHKITQTCTLYIFQQSMIPTFPEFVDFVRSEFEMGAITIGTLHWLPFYRMCGVCQTE